MKYNPCQHQKTTTVITTGFRFGGEWRRRHSILPDRLRKRAAILALTVLKMTEYLIEEMTEALR